MYTDTIYPNLETDSDGNALDSHKTYHLHFKKGGLPQAKYFWSIILYGKPSEQLVINPYKKYLINSHGIDDFYFNEDGCLTMVFDKYDIAPGYMGVCEFVIPKDVTKGILADDYK